MSLLKNLTFNQYHKNVASSWFALALNMIIVFSLTPYIISALGNYKYGIWLLINSLVGYLNFAEMGVNISTGRFVNLHLGKKENVKASEILSTSLSFYLVLPLIILPVVFFTTPLIINNFIQEPHLSVDLYWAIIVTVSVLFINLASANIRIKLNANHRFDIVSLIEIMNTVTRTATIVLMLYYSEEMTLLKISLATLAGTIVSLFLSLALSFKYGKKVDLKLKYIKRSVFIIIISFSGWVMISNLAVLSINYSDNLLISYFISVEDVAIYSIGFMLSSYLGILLSKINQVKNPEITQLVGQQSYSMLNSTLIKLLTFSGIVALPAIITFLLLAQYFIYLWLGSDFDKSSVIAQILVIPLIFNLATQGIGAALWAKGIVKTLSVIKISIAIANLVLSIILLKYMQNMLLGVAYATMLTSLIETLIIMPILAKKNLLISYRSSFRINLFFATTSVCIYCLYYFLIDIISIQSWLSFIAASAIIYITISLVILIIIKLIKPLDKLTLCQDKVLL